MFGFLTELKVAAQQQKHMEDTYASCSAECTKLKQSFSESNKKIWALEHNIGALIESFALNAPTSPSPPPASQSPSPTLPPPHPRMNTWKALRHQAELVAMDIAQQMKLQNNSGKVHDGLQQQHESLIYVQTHCFPMIADCMSNRFEQIDEL